MDTEPVASDRVNRDHVRVVLEFLRERIRQAREPTIAHPHREVSALAVRRADMCHVWLALDRRLDGARALRWAVAALSTLRRGSVHLHNALR
jgi:hypothetical protein